ncbi:hypothetical protein [Bacteroides sedimenti]|uniref:Uncharacterized protein n=1 Tax=Bacteroides sedimenti TaxID=2136147 RepID=A0ABM8ICA1_9BACE
MGLFSKRFELKKEYFDSCFNINETEIYNRRKKHGFNVTKYIDGGAVHIKAERKSFLSTFTITNSKSVFGNHEECVFDVYEMFSLNDAMIFLKQNFTPVPENVRFKFPDGVFRDYYIPSFYLPDGNVLALKNSTSSSWFSLHIISKDRILR